MRMRLCGFILLFIFCCAQSKLLSTTCADIRTYVNGHNIRRSIVAKGQVPRQPPAVNMNLMVWDQELANKASKWALKLRSAHNSDRTIGSGRFRTGENLHWFSTSNLEYQHNLDKALAGWFEEHRNYTYGPYKPSHALGKNAPKIGHYTQMIWADTTYVGCAASQWKDGKMNRFFVVCNYGPAGNIVTQLPYKTGEKGTGKLYCSIDREKCTKRFGEHCKERN